MHLIPLLVAEEDRETLRREGKLMELREMARERGYSTGAVYHDKKNYVKSTFLL